MDIRPIPAWVWLLAAGLLAMPLVEARVSTDMSWYMNSALNITKGKGFTDIDGSWIVSRGPLFPVMIAGTYWLFGVHSESALWVARAFCVMNSLMVYLIGKEFYGKRVGVLASLLAISSHALLQNSLRHIDAVWPFFTLLSLWMICRALDKDSLPLFAASGIVLGTAFLVKEVVVVMMPLPLALMFLLGSVTIRRGLMGCLLCYLAAALTVAPWFYHVFSVSADVSGFFLGKAGGIVVSEATRSESGGPGAFLKLILNYVSGLTLYYGDGSHSLVKNFILAPFFLFSWTFLLVHAGVTKNRYDAILCVAVLLFSPVLAHVGRHDMRLGQGIMVLLLSYLVLARVSFRIQEAAHNAAKRLGRKGSAAGVLGMYAGAAIVVCPMVLQAGIEFPREVAKRWQTGYLFFGLLASDRQISGKASKESSWKEVSQYVRDRISPDGVLMTLWEPDRRLLYFHLKGEYVLTGSPVIQIVYGVSGNGGDEGPGEGRDRKYYMLQSLDKEKAKAWGKPLLISSQAAGYSRRYKRFFVLFEDQLINRIKEAGVSYLIAGELFSCLSLYLDHSPFFEKEAEFGGGRARIYRVDPRIDRSTKDILITRRTSEHLKQLKAREKGAYDLIKTKLFWEVMGFDDAVVERIVAKDYPTGFVEVELGPTRGLE